MSRSDQQPDQADVMARVLNAARAIVEAAHGRVLRVVARSVAVGGSPQFVADVVVEADRAVPPVALRDGLAGAGFENTSTGSVVTRFRAVANVTLADGSRLTVVVARTTAADVRRRYNACGTDEWRERVEALGQVSLFDDDLHS